ncbi:lipopolysaccharide assembly protein LapB [Bibersteinia trehalosi]|uniref:lipopolysaccharide assembly protein LapB n=1 Tax=Bibersteinia trehalosi TaxID=47735 RepID=UPI0040466F58
MLELLFLLLPVAALYGWYMGQRSAKKDQESINNQFSRDYVAGLNFLLSNQQDKAVDLFLSMLQKQETEHQISSQSQFEAELTLGNLFRSRGEVDRALRIHQGLENNPNYSFEQKLLAKQQLAKDFMAVGFYDRAENYYIALLDEPEFAVNSLEQLSVIYQKTREWRKAINVSEKLLKISPDTDKTPLAHFYCEYALLQHSEKEFVQILSQALDCQPNCARASILLGDFYLAREEYHAALNNYQRILVQDISYISEILDKVKTCYIQTDDLESFELFLIKANQIQHNSSVDLALAALIEQKDGVEAAQTALYQQVKQYPHLTTFHRFIFYQIHETEEGRGKEHLSLLYKMVGSRIQKGFHYRCLNCGYQSYRLMWHCPSCRRWESIKPLQSIDEI